MVISFFSAQFVVRSYKVNLILRVEYCLFGNPLHPRHLSSSLSGPY